MKTSQCDAIVLSAMAWMDGESAPIDRAEIERHILTCRQCALQIEALRLAAERLAPLSRAPVTADAWPAIQTQLNRRDSIRTGFVLTAAFLFLVVWRALEAAMIDPLTLWTRPVTVGIAALLFLCLRVNPFRIESRLV
jgi:anti-sigma factor RsiW